MKRKISDLKLGFYVRQKLDENHALLFAELLEAGKKLPAIKITEDGTVVDGRHRIEAHEILRLPEIEVEVVSITDQAKLIATAYISNTGGSLPPTLEDTEQTIMMLLELGEKRASIARLLRLPASMARKHIGNVQSKMARKKLQTAASAVTEGGLTVGQSAQQHKVDLAKLKEFMSPKRAKKHGIPDIQRDITRTYQSVSAKNSRLCRSLLDKFEDGDVTKEQMESIFDHLDSAMSRANRVLSDNRKRFEALAGKNSSETSEASADKTT